MYNEEQNRPVCFPSGASGAMKEQQEKQRRSRGSFEGKPSARLTVTCVSACSVVSDSWRPHRTVVCLHEGKKQRLEKQAELAHKKP